MKQKNNKDKPEILLVVARAKARYIEVPFEIEARTGKEAREKIVDFYHQWEWVEGDFRVDY